EAFQKWSRPLIAINIDGYENVLCCFTTGDSIQGTVTIMPQEDTSFESLSITLEGAARTTVDSTAPQTQIPRRENSIKNFLQLQQPGCEKFYPESRTLKAGETYNLPFTFVVPSHLLPDVCRHSRNNLQLTDAHTQLPPSLAGSMVLDDGRNLLDDLAYESSQICYAITVSITEKPSVVGKPMKNLVTLSKRIRIVSSKEEEPPLNVLEGDDEYCLQKMKTVHRGVMRRKVGCLAAVASQPRPLQLFSSKTEASSPGAVGTTATVHLRFTPEGDEPPLKLGTVSTTLNATTFYGSTPWTDFPSKSVHRDRTLGKESYTKTVPISSMSISSIRWEKHNTTAENDGDFASLSLSSSKDTMISSPGNTVYTTSITVPITLPKDKTFVPTFHSCLISRVYSLDVNISYHTPGANLLTSGISLKLPVQIIHQPRNSDR
ncbi:hypothetical protein BO70DRAFT_279101, partial [Aspergillus heteromorphus CBS 117.55]